MNPIWMLAVLAALGGGLLVGLKLQVTRATRRLEEERARLAEEARQEVETLSAAAEAEARELMLREREKVEKDHEESLRKVREREREIKRQEGDLRGQQQRIASRDKELAKRERSIKQKEQAAEAAGKNAERALQDAKRKLEQVAGITPEEALERLREEMLDQARARAAQEVRKIEEETARQVDARAKELIVTAISRFAGEYVSDRTVSVVQLPSDDLKGRIIGREGRNIRALEAATGVDIIIDDTPEAVILSCFNPVRREVARMALTRLVGDGRIHPSRIEDVVKKCEREVDLQCSEDGEQAVFDLGLHRVHPELVRMLGSLKFRSSYSQNLLQHSVEVGFLAGLMASELGVNVKQARRAGLLHDIGKAADHQVEGSHAEVGAALARKHNEPAKVVAAIAAHHGTPAPRTVLEHLVQAANELSARRPGARRETLAGFVKRLDDLESVATAHQGVKRAYAIQAGREVRVLVDTARVSDDESVVLAKEIARQIEDDLSYPGQIRVNVIRESRASDVAH